MACHKIVWTWCLGLACLISLASPARGQDAPQSDSKGAKGAAKVQPKDDAADAAPAGEAAAPSASRAAFDKKIEEWKQLLKDMRKLKLEFQTALEADHPKFQEQWTALVSKGHVMMPELRDLAVAAYEEAGGADPQLERFLLKFVFDAVDADSFEVAYDVSMKLIEKGCTEKRLIEAAGVSAYCTNRYDDAKKYLEQAKSSGTLSSLGGELLPLITVEQDLWVKEEEIRKQEEAADDLPLVKLTTTKGEIVLELFENQAPDTVGNFVHLVEKGFYDGLTFHRVLQHFVAQGGDPKGDGTGGPGWTIYDEVSREDYRRHFRGSLSMAKTADPNTGGSQFFLTHRQTPNLDGKHTCFGRIKSGLDVLSRLKRMNPEMPEAGDVPDKIIKAEVLRKREHAYVPKKVEQ